MDASIFHAQAEFSRREVLQGVLGGALAAGLGPLSPVVAAGPADPAASAGLVRSTRRYPNKKSINLWAFPYPERMGLKDCFALAKRAGFDAVEVNFDLENDLSPK